MEIKFNTILVKWMFIAVLLLICGLSIDLLIPYFKNFDFVYGVCVGLFCTQEYLDEVESKK